MKQLHHWLRSAARGVVCASLFLVATTGSRAANAEILSPHVPPAVAALHLQPTGKLPDTTRLHLAIGLPSRDQAGLDAFLKQVYDPASPNFRQFLTPAQFTDKFGPAPVDFEALKSFASKNNLVITYSHPNRLLLDVDASVADVRRVFHVQLRTYHHPKENRDFYAPEQEPTLDLAVPVLHITGLDNYVIPHPGLEKMPVLPTNPGAPDGKGSKPSPADGSAPGGSYWGNDFRKAYTPGVALTGAGQSVGLFEFDGYFPQDITTYELQAGLTSPTLINVPVLGGIQGGLDPIDPGIAEVSLDIEMVVSMAPGASAIYVYETSAGSADDLWSRIASDDLVSQVSASWFYGTTPTTDLLFQELAAQGQSVYNAAGDGDAYSGAVQTPGGDAYITMVGGTTLSMNGVGVSYNSEHVWQYGFVGLPGGNPQDTGYLGTGGGINTAVPIPQWQQGINMTANMGSTNFRNFPDVAMTADNIWVVYGSGQQGGFVGTSCAAPLWAGFTALINQQGEMYAYPPLGFINPAVYAIGKSPNYTLCFNDITVGNNTNAQSTNLFFAVPGYDLCTGWGTPIGNNLINALVPPRSIPALFVVTNDIIGGGGVIGYDGCYGVNFLITNKGVASATGLQATLISTTPGAIVAQSSVLYPNLPPHTSANALSSFTLSTESSFVCGTTINLLLVLKSDQATQTNTIQLPSGLIGAPIPFVSSAPVPIPSTNLTIVSSPVTVSGLQAADKLTVSVYIQALYAEGLILQLVSPNGSTVYLSAFDGGLNPNYGTACATNSETTFDDDAANSINTGIGPMVGSFQPLQPLSTFLPLAGTNLNGTWQLSVANEISGNTATLECWSLNVTPYVCADGGGQCPGSTLTMTMSNSPDPVLVGSNLVYTFNVSNAGPSAAESAVISQSLPPGFTFISTSNSPVGVTANGTNLLFTLGTIPVYGTSLVQVVTVPSIPGLATSVATVGSTGLDLNPGDNSASASTVVVLPTADLGVSMTALPAILLQGGNTTFTIVVTNNGPFAAQGVVLTNELPGNANFVSSTTSQGAIIQPGVLFDLGTLTPGSNAVVTVTLSPTTTGSIIDEAQVGLSALETDPVSLNNSASFTVTVGPSADLAVSANVTPATVVAGDNSTYVATVVNNGPSSAINVVFSQTIPGGGGFNSATYVSSSQPVSVTNGVINWNIGNLASGASKVITTVLKAPTIQPGGRPAVLTSAFSVFGQPGDANTNNNFLIVSNLAEIPTVSIAAVSATLVSQSGPVTNGSVNPGETVGVMLFLQDSGNVPTANLVATLQAASGVELPSGPQTYGALQPGAAPVGAPFSFTANSTNGGIVVATLALQDGSTNLGTVSFNFNMPVVQTFWNTNPILIPAAQYQVQGAGPAGPYPSTIQVSNLSGYVSKITVTVSNMYHTYPNDIGLLLVGPGTNTVLMDHAAEGFSDMTGTTLTFDSTASVVLPSFGPLTSGDYAPAYYLSPLYNNGDVFTNVFPPPATNAVAPFSTNLTNFINLSPNGTWSLYGHDDSAGDVGGISNGWAVTITTITPVDPTNSLAVSLAASTNNLVLGGMVRYVFGITNGGATPVNGYLTNVVPAGLSFVSATGSPSNYVQNGQTVVYNLGSLKPGTGVAITNLNMAVAPGLQTNTITAGVPLAAFNTPSSTATTIASVIPPFADVAAGVSVTPSPAVVGGDLTFVLTVTNLGPSNSIATTGSFPLTGLSLVSVAPSQGVFVVTNGAVQCALNTLTPGEFAEVVVTASPTNVGLLTNVWTVGTSSTDTNSVNNSVRDVVSVTYAVPVIVASGANLVTQGLTPPNGAINSNEQVTVALALSNLGAAATTNLTATLQSSGGITPITTTAQGYGLISPGGSAAQLFTFVAKGTPGATITATLALADGAAVLPSVSYSFQIPVTSTFANNSGITINQFGPATPYPSVIQVSNITGVVSKATVTLNNFGHTFPHDVNVLLGSPSGQELILMGHAGGPYSVSNVTLTFDDAAANQLPTTQLTSGSYLTTDYTPVDVFPGLPPASGADALALFNGSNPNGYWELYVYDDTVGNGGFITGGWSLGLTTVQTVNPAALLAVGMIHAPDPVIGGDFLTYLINVTNYGPNAATGVVLTDPLPANAIFSSVVVSQGTGTNVGNTVVCNLGTISNGAVATATIRVVAGSAAGTIVNAVTASSTNIADLYPIEATASNTTVVQNSDVYLQATNSAGNLKLTVLGQANQSYVIQTSPDLSVWISVFSNTPAPGSSSFSYTNALNNTPSLFYRVVHPAQ